MIFPTGLAGKREMSFPMTGQGYRKKRRGIILLVSPGRRNKEKVFKSSPVDKRIIMSLTKT